jgi:hypothetical protein
MLRPLISFVLHTSVLSNHLCYCRLLLLFLPCSKSELFAVVKQPQGLEGPTHITLVTDNANALVLHWGVSRAGEAAAADFSVKVCVFVAAVISCRMLLLLRRRRWGVSRAGEVALCSRDLSSCLDACT